MTSQFQTEQYSLYYFASCPFCIKARLGIWKAGFDIPLRNIKRHSQYKTELVEGGGKKQVPCLRIEHAGEVKWMYESDDIINFFKNLKA